MSTHHFIRLGKVHPLLIPQPVILFSHRGMYQLHRQSRYITYMDVAPCVEALAYVRRVSAVEGRGSERGELDAACVAGADAEAVDHGAVEQGGADIAAGCGRRRREGGGGGGAGGGEVENEAVDDAFWRGGDEVVHGGEVADVAVGRPRLTVTVLGDFGGA